MAAIFDNAKAGGATELAASSVGGAGGILLVDSRCGECEESVATWECLDCAELYCEDCRELVHSKGRRRTHAHFVPIRLCASCHECAAKLLCEECGDQAYCAACCAAVHAQEPWAEHRRIGAVPKHGSCEVSLDVKNGFGIAVKDLTLRRFGGLGHVEGSALFTEELAAWCAEQGRLFSDPEQITLAGASSPRGRDAASSEERNRDARRARELSGVIDRIRLWRRLSKHLARPTLFGAGNDLRRPRPPQQQQQMAMATGAPASAPASAQQQQQQPAAAAALPPPAHVVETLPKFGRGLFDDTWFLLAASLAATNRETFRHIFASAEQAGVGMYTFQFYKPPPRGCAAAADDADAGWRCVTVDDLVPLAPAASLSDGRLEFVADGAPVVFNTDLRRNPDLPLCQAGSAATVRARAGVRATTPSAAEAEAGGGGLGDGEVRLHPAFGTTDQPGETWATLVEKAYAKFLGSYTRLHRGDAAAALSHLTGGRCVVRHWDSDKLAGEEAALLWWRLRTGAKLGLLQACLLAGDEDNAALGRTGLRERAEGEYLEWVGGEGVLATAELSAQQLREMQVRPEQAGGGAHLVLLRNTQGLQEWGGDWSPTSPLWRPAVREYVGYKTMDEYCYWIGIDDFVLRYNTLLCCSGFVGGPLALETSLQGGEPRGGGRRRRAPQFGVGVCCGEEEEELEGGVPVTFCLQQPDMCQCSHNASYADGTSLAVALEVRLYRVRPREMVRPRAAVPGRGVEEEEDYERWGGSAGGGGDGGEESLEWPEVGCLPLEEVPTGSPHFRRLSARLPSGAYALCVCQADVHASEPVHLFVSVHDGGTDNGPHSCPYPVAPQAGGRGQQQQPLSPTRGAGDGGGDGAPREQPPFVGGRLSLRQMGSVESPLIDVRLQRPKTPKEELMDRIGRAKEEGGR